MSSKLANKQNRYLAHNLFYANTVHITRVLSLAICLLGITTAHAEPLSHELLTKHVETLLKGHGDHLQKWVIPVCYRISGLPPAYHKMLADDFARISDTMGLSITEFDAEKIGNLVNVVFAFTDDPKITAKNPSVKKFFKWQDETDEKFQDRLTETLTKNGRLRSVILGTDGVGVVIEISYTPALLSMSNVEIEAQLAVVAFSTVTFATESETLPSIKNPWAMNPGHPRVTLTPVDIAFLKVLNSPDIPHKMPIHEAAQKIAEKMFLQLN